MKTIFATFVILLAVFISSTADAQRMPPQKPILEKGIEIKASRSTMQRFATDVNKGAVLRFTSNRDIASVKISIKKGNASDKHVYSYSPVVKSGYFNLDAPSFKDGSTYMFEFYVPGNNDKYVWVTIAERQVTGGKN